VPQPEFPAEPLLQAGAHLLRLLLEMGSKSIEKHLSVMTQRLAPLWTQWLLSMGSRQLGAV